MINKEALSDFLKSKQKVNGLEYKIKLPDKGREIKVFRQDVPIKNRMKEKS